MLPPRSSRLLALLAVPLFVACGYGDHQRDQPYEGGGCDGYGCGSGAAPSQVTVETATIDTDRLLDVAPGKAGVFVEYEAGGTYHFTTSCEVVEGSACYWDLLVTPLDGAPVLGVAPVDLESDDSVGVASGNQARLVAYTDEDFDGFTLQTEPGAAIELDALLDDGAANRFMFWVGDGALRSGSPSNPVDLVPSDK